MTLGKTLRRTRQAQGRTLADVARAARVSMQYLSELERGQKEASSEVLAALCEALGIELVELLADIGRSLVEEREHRTRVVRLDSIRARRSASRPTGSRPNGSAEARCLLAVAA